MARWGWLAGLLSLLVFSCPAAAGEDLRPDGLAGTWYPAAAAELRASVNRYLDQAKVKSLPGVVALLTPHAGHRYSGAVAGGAWALARSLRPRPATVVLIGPSHRVPLRRPSVWTRGAYDSPLGPVAIDQPLAEAVARALGAKFVRRAHLAEHCLEVQVPFIKAALPRAKLVPILTGPADAAEARRLGYALARVLRGKSVLLVASSDLSHFHDLKQARRLDDRVARRVTALEPDGLMADVAAGRSEACGVIALAVTMHAAGRLGARRGVVLARDTSARSTGDTSRVVGYLAAALVRPAAAGPGLILSHRQMARLRELARLSVVAAVAGRPLPKPPTDDPVLARPPGRVFVTLKTRGRLRGCLGHLGGDLPLAQAVILMAAASARQDPRFRPVRPEELEHLELEISVLTPFRPCRPEQVRVGVHGLVMSRRWRRGLLLPQVPGEQGWDRRQFLAGTCRKAGMEPNCWQDPATRLECFQALVF